MQVFESEVGWFCACIEQVDDVWVIAPVQCTVFDAEPFCEVGVFIEGDFDRVRCICSPGAKDCGHGGRGESALESVWSESGSSSGILFDYEEWLCIVHVCAVDACRF